MSKIVVHLQMSYSDKILAHGEGEKAYFDVGIPGIKMLV